MAPFYGWGSTASRLQSLRGGSLLFTIQFPEFLVHIYIYIYIKYIIVYELVYELWLAQRNFLEICDYIHVSKCEESPSPE